MNVVLIPINSDRDSTIFKTSVLNQVETVSLEPLLFGKLYDSISAQHATGKMSLWGFSAGELSTNANKWNLLSNGDLAVFSGDSGILGVAIIVAKLQSESIAQSLWNISAEEPDRRYLLTFRELVILGDEVNVQISKLLKQAGISPKEFQISDNSKIIHALSDLGLFNDGLFSSNTNSSIEQYIAKVLELQKSFSSTNTDAMRQRGEWIRDAIPHILSSDYLDNARDFSGIRDLEISGNDGVGLKSEIPYVRIYSKELSPRPTMGWYLVLLFEAEGNGFYLSLCHASTKNLSEKSGAVQFTPRSPEEMGRLIGWAETKLAGTLLNIPNSVRKISLGSSRSNLGKAYENTTLIAFHYSQNSIPSLYKLREDINSLLPLLKELYEAQLSDPTQPGEPTPELFAAVEAIEVQSGGRKARSARRQGFGLSAAERKAVEQRAVEIAIEFYKNLGYSKIEDVGAFESYDLKVQGENVQLFVEVKGTTSHGESIILTRNEVALHQREFPANALFIVSHIELVKGEKPVATGGVSKVISPWQINTNLLVPLGYEYDVTKS